MTKLPRPEAGQYHPYYQAYLDQVPADVTDILRHLKKQGLIYLNLLKGMTDEQAAYRYAAGKWSIKEMIGHLIDTERLFAFRFLWIARGDGQPQPGVDENRWGAHSNAAVRPLPELWREQHVCRTDHVYLFRSVDREGLLRSGECNGAMITAEVIPWLIAGHEQHHLKVLQERYGVKI